MYCLFFCKHILCVGTYDFYGLNHYTARKVRRAKPGENIGPWPFYGSKELGIVLENDPSWAPGIVDWFAVRILLEVKKNT